MRVGQAFSINYRTIKNVCWQASGKTLRLYLHIIGYQIRVTEALSYFRVTLAKRVEPKLGLALYCGYYSLMGLKTLCSVTLFSDIQFLS